MVGTSWGHGVGGVGGRVHGGPSLQLPAGLGVQRCSEQNCFGPLIPGPCGKRGSLLPDLRVEVTSASTVGLELDWSPQPRAAPMGFVSEPCGLVRFSGPPWGLLPGAGGTEACPPAGRFSIVAPMGAS